jgi:uncharacterized C2H2 Zn-finger protein
MSSVRVIRCGELYREQDNYLKTVFDTFLFRYTTKKNKQSKLC